MATLFVVAFPQGQGSFSAAELALDEIDRLEQQLSIYRTDSELSYINQQATTKVCYVETRLFELLTLAQKLHEETEGAFDCGIGKLIAAWGFFKGPAKVPTPDELKTAMAESGMRLLKLLPEAQSIRFFHPGLQLNLGSIGKGYAIDRAIETLRTQANIQAALLTGGFSSIYGLGLPHVGSRGWMTTIQHPFVTDAKRPLVNVYLKDQAIGTSAATFKNLIHEGKKLGHILDPRTGWPASGISSASIIAPTAALADALSTAFYIQGIDFAKSYCQKHPDVAAIMLRDGHEKPECICYDAELRQSIEI